MVFDIIKHGGDTLHTCIIDNIDRDHIIKKIYDMVSFFRPGQVNKDYRIPGAKNSSQPGPGIQIWLSHIRYDDEIIKLEKQIINAILETNTIITGRKVKQAYQTNWVFISTDKNLDTNYHDHADYMPEEPSISTSFTYVYYVQIPDNLSGDEGKIFFDRDLNDETALKFLPQEGQLVIFPASLPHRPEINPNSTKDRITIAGNVALQFENKSLV